ncbi:hypothetical protein JR065_14020 [Xanthomonas sp. AmX2]|uniref:hypothetical protein n=1 Tax=Xanthomonas sp. TaxID=29446 RepID=UPI0019808FE3|nr:hypothetical protein [Xanthomonas sp.]MBN6151458.1 hypothetical protein [Xanthomonas sp.]
MSQRYGKTEAGRQEIVDRGRRLPAVLRSILLIVDGQKEDAALQQIIGGLHAPADALSQLEQMGLIQRGAGDPVPAAATATSPAPAAAAASEAPHADAPPLQAEVSDASAQRHSRLYDAMSEAVRQHLGLKGYFMQLKIERCSDVAALEALLPEFVAALAKATSPALASRWMQETLQTDATN